MNGISLRFKSYFSTWLIGVFILSLLLLAVFSEYFQKTSSKNSSLDLLNNPIPADILENIKTIRIKNRLGTFMATREQAHWILKEPRVLPAKSKTINKIINSFKDLNIHTLHQYEPINIQTYSLDTPILVIDLYSKLDDQLKIKIGLVNPISNTSYMTIGNHKTIFQTEIIKNHIELMDLSDFFESHIFSMPLNEITSFELYRRGSKVSVNKLTKKGQNWKSKMYRSITNKNVDAKLNSILNIKTHTIIDEQDEKLKTFLKNYMDNPLYTIKIKSGKKEVTYKISSLINALPKLKLEKRQYFIMLASDRQFPYIIKKESLDKFYMRYSQIR